MQNRTKILVGGIKEALRHVYFSIITSSNFWANALNHISVQVYKSESILSNDIQGDYNWPGIIILIMPSNG